MLGQMLGVKKEKTVCQMLARCYKETGRELELLPESDKELDHLLQTR